MAESLSFSHPLFNHATLYFSDDGRGVLVIKQYWNSKLKCTFWSDIGDEWAYILTTSDKFAEWFEKHATQKPYNYYEFRKVLWALGFRPGPKKEFWETRF